MNALLKSLGVPLLLILLLGGMVAAVAQDAARIDITKLAALETKAIQTVEVTVDSQLIKLAYSFLNDKKPTEAKVKEILRGLKGIYVRSYKFQNEAEYSPLDVNPIRLQLNSPGSGWSRMVNVRSKVKNEDIEVFTMLDNGSINGLAVIAVQAKRLTVVNVVGPIDLNKLSELEGKFGIPQLNLETGLGLNKTPELDSQPAAAVTDAQPNPAPPQQPDGNSSRDAKPKPKLKTMSETEPRTPPAHN